LIELLVVLGIIALLVGLLLPALERARSTAKRVICASNQRQLVAGLNNYAQDFDGFLPAYVSPLSPNAINLVNSPRMTYRLAVADSSSPADQVKPVNHGQLHSEGYVTAGEVFYCPSQSGENWQPDHYQRPWMSVGDRGEKDGQAVEDGLWLVRSAYMYNPYAKPGFTTNFRRFDKLVNFPDDAAMMMDLLIGADYQTQAHEASATWNIAFADGHVEAQKSRQVARVHKEYGDLGWQAFRIFRDVLVEGDN
jgi:hypothetical protein